MSVASGQNESTRQCAVEPEDRPRAEGGDADVNGARAERRGEVKVGAFVLFTLLVAVGVTLALAQKRHLFESRVVIHTVFQEVQGLKEGAPVRLSGVDIGRVSRLAFAEERTASLIHVDMEISKESLARIGVDSVARIGSQGLLGDKILELSVSGNPDRPIAAGATLESQPAADLNKLFEQASEVLAQAKVVADHAADFVQGVSDPTSLENVRGIMQSVQRLTSAAEKGPGLIHAIFFDPASTRSFNGLLVNMEKLSGHVDHAVAQLDQVLGATDKDGLQLVNNLSRAARNVGDVAGSLQDSKLVLHLDQASEDLAAMTAYTRAGHGTVGLALMDPTVYEQLMTVLGGVGRSRILRALVRYAILNDDGQRVGKAVDEPTPAVAPVPTGDGTSPAAEERAAGRRPAAADPP